MPSSRLYKRALQEPWLIAVLGVQAFLFVTIIKFRKSTSYLSGIFVLASRHEMRYCTKDMHSTHSS